MKPSYDTVTATQLILEDDDIPDDSDDERLSADGDDEYLPGSPDPNSDSGTKMISMTQLWRLTDSHPLAKDPHLEQAHYPPGQARL